METINTTLELIGLDSGEDELDSDFERELLSGSPPENPEISSKQTNQQINNEPSSLDDRIIEMEFKTLQDRINVLVENNVAFGRSGLMVAAVAFKDLTPQETKQLQINACAVSTFMNRVQEKLDDPSFMGFVTISLVTDDLYQAGFQIDAS